MKECGLSSKHKVKIISYFSLTILILLLCIVLSILCALWILSFGSDGRLYILAILPVLYALSAIVIFFTYKSYRTNGILVTKHIAPQLFELIENSAKKVGFDGHIEDVILTPGISVRVYYSPNLLNFFFSSTAKLYIGVSICNVLSKEELCAVISHELAHLSQPQTKYKAYLARISNITSRLGRNGVVDSNGENNRTVFLGLYALPARFFSFCFNKIFEAIFDESLSDYLKVTAEMELEADMVAARAFGAEKMLSALCKSSGVSDRLSLYKHLILPYLSCLGYRCNGFWRTFEATYPLFMAIDGMKISNNKPLFGLNRTYFDLSERILAMRLEALENLSADLDCHNTVSTPSIDAIPAVLVSKMDDFLCRKYGQTKGIKIYQLRYYEILRDLRSEIFEEIHSMKEAFAVVKKLFEEIQKNQAGEIQTFMPEYEKPPNEVFQYTVIRQPTELIYSCDIEHCPVCGYKISIDTEVCPQCHEKIS